jgi:hypothetical protein
MLAYSEWLALRPKRKAIEAAFHALGMPHTGWMNEVPQFKPGYTPDWTEIDRIASTVDTIPVAKPKPAPKAAAKKPAPKGRKTK